MIPERLSSPTVGLIPTRPLTDDGHVTEPSVSVPTAAAQRFAAAAAPDPELEPHGLRSSAYGLRVSPPRPLQPLVEWPDRKFAHSLRLVLPRSTAPASRSRLTMKASRGAIDPARASDPAVVIIRSAVSMLSLIRTGMPCMAPRMPFSLRSLSSASAIERASGLISIMVLTDGPCLSISSMRARYRSAMDLALCLPDCMPACNCAMVASSRSKGFTETEAVEDWPAPAGAADAVPHPRRLAPKNVLRFM